MSLDLDAIRAKLNQLNTTSDRKNNYFRPEPGKQRVRIVPYVHRKENPFLEMYFHYDIAKRTMLSPITFGNADPVVEFAEKLKATGDRNDYQLSRKLTPKMRTYVPILVRGEESEGVKFWGFGKNVYQELLGFFADPDYGDLTDPVNGRDVTVEFKTAAELGKTYPETYIRVKPNTSSISEDKNVLETAKDQIVLGDMFKKVSYEEMEGMLKEWLDTGEVSDKKEEPKVEVKETTTATSPASNVKEAFDDLFNE